MKAKFFQTAWTLAAQQPASRTYPAAQQSRAIDRQPPSRKIAAVQKHYWGQKGGEHQPDPCPPGLEILLVR